MQIHIHHIYLSLHIYLIFTYGTPISLVTYLLSNFSASTSLHPQQVGGVQDSRSRTRQGQGAKDDHKHNGEGESDSDDGDLGGRVPISVAAMLELYQVLSQTSTVCNGGPT